MGRRIAVLLFVIAVSAICMGLTGGGCGTPDNVSYVDVSDMKMSIDSNGLTCEQANIKKRVELASNPNNLWWIYCIAENGQTVYYGPVKGKVTSSTKRLSIASTSSSVSLDGTEGESDAYVYWFDAQGIFYQWSGHYFLTSKEVKIANAVLNFREVK